MGIETEGQSVHGTCGLSHHQAHFLDSYPSRVLGQKALAHCNKLHRADGKTPVAWYLHEALGLEPCDDGAQAGAVQAQTT